MDIGQKLKEKRLEADYTQKELAEILHVSRQTISSWEVGRTYPDLDVLVAMSELYDTPLDDLLKEDSQMVKDISEKVKKSERRKVVNIILGALLIVAIGIGVFSVWERQQNDQANEYGLKPNDLFDSTWEKIYSPNPNIHTSRLSFDSNSLIIWNDFTHALLPPTIDSSDLEEPAAEWTENGLLDGFVTYEDLRIEVNENTYIVSAHGYQERFERLHETMIRDSNGTEYSKVSSASSHDTFNYFSEELNN